jgi:hypothetical protein
MSLNIYRIAILISSAEWEYSHCLVQNEKLRKFDTMFGYDDIKMNISRFEYVQNGFFLYDR